MIEMIRHHARRAYEEAPFDLIVTGHMHVKDDFEFHVGSRKIRSINLGSWFNGTQILRMVDGHLDWLTLD
ncbi:MAG: hypothetical protein IPK04_13320 [Bdellovibrionales bacterium]|nr:hypothetical protein [Bdellovibrionales bacterium]